MTCETYEILEYRALKGLVAELTESPIGARLFEELTPLALRSELQKQFNVTKECLQLLESGKCLKLAEVQDLTALFQRARIEGNTLSPEELLLVLKLVICAQSAKRLLCISAQPLPNLFDIGRALPDLSFLISKISSVINDSAEIEDDATPALKKIRNQIQIARNRIYRSLTSILQWHNRAHQIQDDVITVRNERFVIPVRTEKRRGLPGVVHGASSSGSTVFLEPLETVELNNQLMRLKEEEDREIRSILQTLTSSVRESLKPLHDMVRLLGFLDFSFAKARFFQKYRCCIPQLNEERVLRIADGRHPILDKTLRAQGEEIIPLSVDLDGSQHVLVITGPNTGGKTVALKTIGLLTLMALSGIPVPAAIGNFCTFQKVFADIGDRQSISENLSTFSGHLINIKGILERADSSSLVLIDELGTGTDPSDGAALGIALVENLRRKGATTVVTTHLNRLKFYAAKTTAVRNASVEFDEATFRPTYRLIHGIPGSSSGIEIARRLGLDESIILHAQTLVSEQEQEINLYSRHLREQVEAYATMNDQISRERKELDILRTRLEREYENSIKSKTKEIEDRWQRAVSRLEKESSKLVSQVKDRYLAVQVQRKLQSRSAKLREEVGRDLLPGSDEDGVSQLRLPTSSLRLGAKVIVSRLGLEGRVVAAHQDGKWEVSVGNLKCVVGSSEIELCGEPNESEKSPFRLPSNVTLQVNSPELQSIEINLIGCTVDEAIGQADKFLDQAYLASLSHIRLIHGSGKGVLRKAISEWLTTQPHVDKFHAAGAEDGGNGVTVVSLKL